MAEDTIAQGSYTTGLYIHAQCLRTPAGLVYWSIPERLVYDDLDGCIYQEAAGGEYLVDLVISQYKELYANPTVLLGVVCEFQPDPIIDPSIPLRPGQVIVFPPFDYCDEAFSAPMVEYPEV